MASLNDFQKGDTVKLQFGMSIVLATQLLAPFAYAKQKHTKTTATDAPPCAAELVQKIYPEVKDAASVRLLEIVKGNDIEAMQTSPKPEKFMGIKLKGYIVVAGATCDVQFISADGKIVVKETTPKYRPFDLPACDGAQAGMKASDVIRMANFKMTGFNSWSADLMNSAIYGWSSNLACTSLVKTVETGCEAGCRAMRQDWTDPPETWCPSMKKMESLGLHCYRDCCK